MPCRIAMIRPSAAAPETTLTLVKLAASINPARERAGREANSPQMPAWRRRSAAPCASSDGGRLSAGLGLELERECGGTQMTLPRLPGQRLTVCASIRPLDSDARRVAAAPRGSRSPSSRRGQRARRAPARAARAAPSPRASIVELRGAPRLRSVEQCGGHRRFQDVHCRLLRMRLTLVVRTAWKSTCRAENRAREIFFAPVSIPGAP